MTIEDKYNFKDFTLKNYKNLLNKTLNLGYKFVRFEFDQVNNMSVLWRHDLEFSVDIALTMAEYEKALGIKATYFIQLHSPFYNTLEAETHIKIKKIIELGHDVGLHFDAHFYNIRQEKELDKFIEQDKEWLEKLFNIKLSAFSFHNNTPFTLSCKNKFYGGLINVYSDFFKNNYRYCSDSTGFWRYERLEDFLEQFDERKGLQVLIHDGMWQHEVLPPRKRIHRIIDNNAKLSKEGYDYRLSFFKGKNIDWKGDINGKD